eukprot:TRINITY_DN31038_c0_g1_i2.p4 TRINITY_DN31038_c0_g1~~TRINITY_DN31038_c0_g1_i2.p4  ORF type:complete len:108 (-),score=16.53 TRINITY_DN31038_c0_g1_i2:44-367(-)
MGGHKVLGRALGAESAEMRVQAISPGGMCHGWGGLLDSWSARKGASARSAGGAFLDSGSTGLGGCGVRGWAGGMGQPGPRRSPYKQKEHQREGKTSKRKYIGNKEKE